MEQNNRVTRLGTVPSQGLNDGPVDWLASFHYWPSLVLELELLPWHWSFGVAQDKWLPEWRLNLGALSLVFHANDEPFPIQRRPL